MNLNSLPKLTTKSKKRIGRGIGSGRGKTSGRGTKGQKARGKIPALFSGSGFPLYKVLPLNRGWGNKKVSTKPSIIKVSQLNMLKPKTVVTIESLIEGKVLSAKAAKRGVKILAQGELTVPLSVTVPVSKKVAKMIEKAGGNVVS